MNDTPLLGTPLTVTTTLPLEAPAGTVTVMLVSLQPNNFGVAAIPLNVTLLVPCAGPKFVPAIVTEAPAAPDAGVRLVIVGADSTANNAPLLATPFTVTTTLPVVAPEGTVATTLLALQLPMAAAVPLKVTVPVVVPKLLPAMVIAVPTAPEVGLRLEMLGAVDPDAGTVNVTPRLETPPVFTTTLPVVAPDGTVATILVVLQLLIAAEVPLKVTVPVVVFPKLTPLMVTTVPTAPEVGLSLEMLGAAGGFTVRPKPWFTPS